MHCFLTFLNPIRHPLRLVSAALTFATTPLIAEVPRVVTDIRPLQSIAASVMHGVATPGVLLPPGASPHHYAMRPSDARLLQSADLILLISPELTPWLPEVVENLAPAAEVMAMAEISGTALLKWRESEVAGAHNHGADHHDDNHGDEDHYDDDHHDDDHHEADHHSDEHHGAFDPHLWLDPQNAAIWAQHIAAVLAAKDADNAATYLRNAQEFVAHIDAIAIATAQLADTPPGLQIFTWHDSYQYFENRFNVVSAGAISQGDASPPGAAHLREIGRVARAGQMICVLTEPGYNAGLSDAAFGHGGYQTAEADPLGAALADGPGLYPALIRSVAEAFNSCNTGSSALIPSR